MASYPLSIPLPSGDLQSYAGGLLVYARHGAHADLAECHSTGTPKTFARESLLRSEALMGTPWLNALRVESGSDPFPYLIGLPAMRPSLADSMLCWLNAAGAWHLNDGGFYSALEKDLMQESLPAKIATLFTVACLNELQQQASRIFQVPLRLCGAIAAHRMDVGHGIGIHSDLPRPEEETHRLIVTLTEESASSGGHFILLSGKTPYDARRLVPLRHNLAIAFALSAISYHAVTNIQAGRRYSIVFSFCPIRT